MTIRALIVDDEPLARQRIRSLLRSESDIEVIGECANGQDAVAVVRAQRPDLLFLDVQMPHLDGFGVLESLGRPLPVVIFITAHDRYALKAFEVHALDYLLKPFDRERFRKTLDRARAQVQGTDVNQRLLALLGDVQKSRAAGVDGRKAGDRLAVKSGGRVYFVRFDEIDWIEAAGNYVRLHVGKDSHLLRETMNGLEERLDPDRFLRIHRSTIINLDRIRELQPAFHGDYMVFLRDGTELTLSRGYRDRLQQRFGELF